MTKTVMEFGDCINPDGAFEDVNEIRDPGMVAWDAAAHELPKNRDVFVDIPLTGCLPGPGDEDYSNGARVVCPLCGYNYNHFSVNEVLNDDYQDEHCRGPVIIQHFHCEADLHRWAVCFGFHKGEMSFWCRVYVEDLDGEYVRATVWNRMMADEATYLNPIQIGPDLYQRLDLGNPFGILATSRHYKRLRSIDAGNALKEVE